MKDMESRRGLLDLLWLRRRGREAGRLGALNHLKAADEKGERPISKIEMVESL